MGGKTHADSSEPVQDDRALDVAVQVPIADDRCEDDGDDGAEVDEGPSAASEQAIREPGIRQRHDDENGRTGQRDC